MYVIQLLLSETGNLTLLQECKLQCIASCVLGQTITPFSTSTI